MTMLITASTSSCTYNFEQASTASVFSIAMALT
jgi:hypothetical protein